MSNWIDHTARRLLLAGAIAFAVGAPTIACMGGGETSDDDGKEEHGGGDEAGGDDDAGGDEGGDEKPADDGDLAKRLEGSWNVAPPKEEIRPLRVIDFALRDVPAAQMQKKLKPPPTPDEMKLYEDAKKLAKDSPDRAMLETMIKMMKGSRLEVTADKWVYTIAEDRYEMGWSVKSKEGNKMVVDITNGPGGNETHELTFDGADLVHDQITSPSPQKLQFNRK